MPICIAQSSIFNNGADCYEECNNTAGPCESFCGPQGVCCRFDAKEPCIPEVPLSNGYASIGCFGKHCCAKRPTTTSTSVASLSSPLETTTSTGAHLGAQAYALSQTDRVSATAQVKTTRDHSLNGSSIARIDVVQSTQAPHVLNCQADNAGNMCTVSISDPAFPVLTADCITIALAYDSYGNPGMPDHWTCEDLEAAGCTCAGCCYPPDPPPSPPNPPPPPTLQLASGTIMTEINQFLASEPARQFLSDIIVDTIPTPIKIGVSVLGDIKIDAVSEILGLSIDNVAASATFLPEKGNEVDLQLSLSASLRAVHLTGEMGGYKVHVGAGGSADAIVNVRLEVCNQPLLGVNLALRDPKDLQLTLQSLTIDTDQVIVEGEGLSAGAVKLMLQAAFAGATFLAQLDSLRAAITDALVPTIAAEMQKFMSSGGCLIKLK